MRKRTEFMFQVASFMDGVVLQPAPIVIPRPAAHAAESPPHAFPLFREETTMTLLLIIVLVIVLLGGGGGYYGYRTWGGPGLGGVLGLVLVILLILYLMGGLPVR
jgi:hypothetical protein